MAPGPRVLTGNRFSGFNSDPLAEPNNKKRKKPNYSPCELDNVFPTTSNTKNPRFITIAPTNPDKPLSSFSVFLLKKAIDSISTSYEYITQLRDGNLLILVKSQKIAECFLSKKVLSNLCPISVKLHEHLNSSKGTVYAPCLINVPESEILEEMKSQGVTDVYKFKKVEDGNQRPTGLVLFTFDLFRPPSTVNVGWYNLKVEEYFPNPMRCRNCQLLGHTAKRCKGNASCDTCNLPPHSPNRCTRVSCANCAEQHPSSSKNCKRYLQAKEILKIKTIRKCSMAEAKSIFREENPISNSTPAYSAVTKHSTESASNTVATDDKTSHNNSLDSNSNSSPNPPPPQSNPAVFTANKRQDPISLSSNEHNNKNSTPKPLSNNTNQITNPKSDSKYTSSTSNLPESQSVPEIPIFSHNCNSDVNLAPISPLKHLSNPQSKLADYTPNSSPISTVTQSLIMNNQYYLKPPQTENDDDI